jgi:hypothetical protein
MDFFEALKTVSAFLGTGLGVWNLWGSRWSGVRVDRRPSAIQITNTGARPVYAAFVGFIQPVDWKPTRAAVTTSRIQDPGFPYTIDPWRTLTLTLDLAVVLSEGWDPKIRTYWMVHMENGAFFTTIPWYRLYAHWKARREMRRERAENPFMTP